MVKVKKKDEPLCEYEKLRLKNIEEREELYREVLEAKNLVSKAFRKRKAIPKPKEPLPPRDKSRRIAAAERGEVVVKYTDDLELRTLVPEEIYHRVYKPRVPGGLLNDSFEFKLDLSKQLFHLISLEMKATERKIIPLDKNQFIERLDRYTSKNCGLRMKEASCCSIHPTNNMILGCAGSDDGKIFLGRLKLGQVVDRNKKIEDYDCFITHTGRICHQTWDKFDSEKLITSSKDGTVRIFDINSLQSSLLFGEQKFLDANGSCYCHAQIDRDTFLISKGIGNKGKIGIMDTRSGVTPVQEFYHSSSVPDMKSLDVHPLRKFEYLAADGDGNIQLFDTRLVKETGRGKRYVKKGVPLATFENDEPDSFAHWSPITGNKMMVSNPTEMKLYSSQSWLNRIPVHHQIDFRLRKDHDNRAQGMGHWHPKYDDVYIKISWINYWLSTWIVDTEDTAIAPCKRMHSLAGTGRLMENFAIHPSLDVIIGFSIEGRMTVLEYEDTNATDEYDNSEATEEYVNSDATKDVDSGATETHGETYSKED